jgi:hypothetical protein
MAGSMLVALPTSTFADEPTELDLAQNVEKTAVAVSTPIFRFTIKTPADNSEFILPTSSVLDGEMTPKSYNWVIDWGDGSIEYALGESWNGGGISHYYNKAGEYAISISPNGSTEAWLAAFGFSKRLYTSNYREGIDDPDSLTLVNKAMVIEVKGPLTPDMTRTLTQISGTTAAPYNEWAYLFYGCSNFIKGPETTGWENITRVDYGFASHMFDGCSSLAELPKGFNLPQGINTVDNNFVANMFSDCYSLISLPEGFNLPQGITEADAGFAYSMFSSCISLATLPEGFNLPHGIKAVRSLFAYYMFYNCASLFALPDGFNLPQGIASVSDGFAQGMFMRCRSITTFPDSFNLPQGITSTGNSFVYGMFENCTSLLTLPDGFNLPQGITMIGGSFANSLFYSCNNLETLPQGFNIPQGITAAKDGFAANMFAYCRNFSSLPESFNIPQGITSVGNSFLYQMFFHCVSLAELPSRFSLPQGITEVGNGCMVRIFYDCSNLASLPDNFNLPQSITKVGDSFVASMFDECTSLSSLPYNFNLPQGVTEVGDSFASFILSGAGDSSFQINNALRIPVGIPGDAKNAFAGAFQLSVDAPVQNRTAASIIGDSCLPDSQRYTFDWHFKDLDYIDVNWGGKGLPQPNVGAPGSGDLFGDGVTVANALIVARMVVGVGNLTPEQFAAADMDFDGVLTMVDVMLIMRKAASL